MFDLYRRTEIGDVTTYVRPCQTISFGPLVGNKSMVISEEMIMILPDASTVRVPLETDELRAEIVDPLGTFNLLNPVTDAVIGTMTFAQLQTYMYSLYRHLAAIRDTLPPESAMVSFGDGEES